MLKWRDFFFHSYIQTNMWNIKRHKWQKKLFVIFFQLFKIIGYGYGYGFQ